MHPYLSNITCLKSHQSGSTMVVAMLMLALLLTLGSSSMQASLFEQKIGGSLVRAIQAFERTERNVSLKGKQFRDANTTEPIGSNILSSSENTINPAFWLDGTHWQQALPCRTNGIARLDPVTNSFAPRCDTQRFMNTQESEPASPSSVSIEFARITSFTFGMTQPVDINGIQATYFTAK